MTYVALWTWPDGARYVRAFRTAQERQTAMERVLEGREGWADEAVQCSDGSHRNLGSFDRAEPFDLIERRSIPATVSTTSTPPPPPGSGNDKFSGNYAERKAKVGRAS